MFEVLSAQDCRGVARVLSRVGDKWSILVILQLDEGRLRFSALKRRLGAISQRMLTLTLRGLERDGLVAREVTHTVPPCVHYELTGLGRSLCEPVAQLGAWARTHLPEIADAQASFDRKAMRPKTRSATTAHGAGILGEVSGEQSDCKLI